MTKFSGKQAAPKLSSPLRTKTKQSRSTETYEGGEGFERDAKSELFLLAVSNMVGEDTFYESAGKRDNRFAELAFKVTKKDPEWIRNFIPYLRNTMQMRSASIVLAAHYVAAGGDKRRSVVDSAISRADEPAEFLAFWAQTYGKNFPMAVKRGVADAVVRLYNEWNVLKYDGQSKAWRFGDVIELTHPKADTPAQSELFKYLISSRHNREDLSIPESASMLSGIEKAYSIKVDRRRTWLKDNGMPKGMTWERLSEYLQGPMDAEAWESVIPQMGYMALLRNLRNFDQAGISKDSVAYVRDFIGDAEQVAKSRQFPIRFYSAWKATDSLTYASALEDALDFSVANVPEVNGNSLVLIDVSGSMDSRISNRSDAMRYEVAAVFGAAWAKRNVSDVVVFQSNSELISSGIMPGSIIRAVDKISNYVGGGTNTWDAVRRHYVIGKHKRVIIITDEQAHPSYRYSYGSESPFGASDVKCPLYTFNLAGYKTAHAEQGENGSYVFGGLTDAGFKMIATLESLKDDHWPWEAA